MVKARGLYEPISKFRKQRIVAIGKEIGKGEYDIVLLEEIWVQKDYDTLCNLILNKLPYTHYFHSGMIGSGMCIFSRYSILETFQHQYSLCGFAHKFLHGDWFGGKSVGLAQILCEGFRINVYVTHTHADYKENELYKSHRTVQAYELSQFIKHTSEGCDVVIIGGDFNFQPHHQPLQMAVANANLLDSWVSQKCQISGDDGLTSGVRGSPFTKSKNPGKRIDYLFYRNNSGTSIECEKCYTTMKNVEGEPFHYSDHAAVAAHYTLKKNVTALPPYVDTEVIDNHFNEALPVIDEGMRKARADQVFYGIALFLCLVALGFMSHLSLPFGMTTLRVLFTLGIGFCAWMGIIGCTWELNGLTATRKDIYNLLKSKKE